MCLLLLGIAECLCFEKWQLWILGSRFGIENRLLVSFLRGNLLRRIIGLLVRRVLRRQCFPGCGMILKQSRGGFQLSFLALR